jgi:hypothetical protein
MSALDLFQYILIGGVVVVGVVGFILVVRGEQKK